MTLGVEREGRGGEQCVAGHLGLDEMWRNPRTLFWPWYGLTFDKGDLGDWIPGMVHALTTEPVVYVPEIIGFAIWVFFVTWLVRQRKVNNFAKYGRI